MVFKHPYDNFFKKRWLVLKEAQGLLGKLKALAFLLRVPLGKSLSIVFSHRYGKFLAIRQQDVWSSLQDTMSDIQPFMTFTHGTFVDVGANIGRYTILVSKRLGSNGKVIGFEPEKENFSILSRNVELNKLNNCVLIPKGCFSKSGTLKFYLHDSPGKHSLMEKTSRCVQIEVVTLDEVLLKEKNIIGIKIDAEGADYEVLKGARKTISKHKPLILFESSVSENLSQEYIEIKNFLVGQGYEIFQANPWNKLALKKGTITPKQKQWIREVNEMYSKSRWKN